MGELSNLQNTVRSFGGFVSDKLGLHSKAQVEVNFAQKEVREKVVQVWNQQNKARRSQIYVGKDNQFYYTFSSSSSSSKQPVKFYANSNELTGLLTKKPEGSRKEQLYLCKGASDTEQTLEDRVARIVGRLTLTQKSPEEAENSWCTKLEHALFGTPEERAARAAEQAKKEEKLQQIMDGYY
jgi:hypothetical protein